MFTNPRQPLFFARRHLAAIGVRAPSTRLISLVLVLVLITCAGAG